MKVVILSSLFLCSLLSKGQFVIKTDAGERMITDSTVLETNLKKDGKKNGWWIIEKKGKIIEVKHFSNGKLNGRYFKFYPSGHSKVMGEYLNGEKNGWFSYHKDRRYHSSFKSKTYKNGKLIKVKKRTSYPADWGY